MKVTKELIESDINSMEAQLEQAKGQVNKILGSIATLRGVKEYLEKPEPEVKEEPPAVPVSEIAEAVAGPGAVAEEPVALPSAAEIWEANSSKVVDGNGKYV